MKTGTKRKVKRALRPDPVVVHLSIKDKSELKRLLSHGGGLVRIFKKARILQLLDNGHSTSSAADAVGVSVSTARRTGQRYNSGGLEHAIHDNPRPGSDRILDAKQEAAIVAMVCSKVPDGFARWSASLIVQEAVRREIVEEVSKSTIARLLRRHELKPWREKNVVRR